MKKRFYALLLALLLLLTAFPLTALADGEDAPELTISAVREGDALTVTVGIVNNPGIAGFDLALHFNSAALTPSGAPAAADGWGEYAVTNYDEPFSGDTLRVAAARQTDFDGDTLFTAAFTVTGGGVPVLSVSGTACAEAAEECIGLAEVFADAFGVSVERTAGGVTFTAASYGNGYHGEAKAILARYRNGQFAGCVMQDITVAENGETDAVLAVSGGGQTEEWKLLLLDAAYRPIAEAKTL